MSSSECKEGLWLHLLHLSSLTNAFVLHRRIFNYFPSSLVLELKKKLKNHTIIVICSDNNKVDTWYLKFGKQEVPAEISSNEEWEQEEQEKLASAF
jgi:hypothetical protein